MSSTSYLLCLFDRVEDGLVFGQEAGGSVYEAGTQAAGIVLDEAGEIVADAQSKVRGSPLCEFRDVVIYACTELSLRRPRMVTDP
ncbi:hypothetical protein [Streptomyces sp. NPDC095817]|uniref:hypothetical protein n=1 Tax=Streptomyces sp. NPDC095817 TaxID=3155082 RepID=UPI00331C0BD1